MSEGEGTPPVVIVRPETTISGGTAVQEKMIGAARAFADILKPTFGPRGLDKMLYKTDGTTAVTNDGAKIVAELMVKHPAAKSFVSLAESQENSCGDGVTRCLLFCGELLAEADRLIRMGLHPLTITDGFLAALDIVETNIEKCSNQIISNDEELLQSIASTALRGKSADQNLHLFSKLVSLATLQIISENDDEIKANAEDISMYLQGNGGLHDSRIIPGIIIRRRVLLDRLEGKRNNVRIAVINGDLAPRSLSRESEIEVESPEQLSQFIDEQERLRSSLVEDLVNLGVQAIVVSGEVDRDLLHHLVDEGIFVAGELDDSELKNLALATGSTIASSSHHLEQSDIGLAKEINCIRKPSTDRVEDEIIILGGKNSQVATIVVGGVEGTAGEEVIRGLYDAIRSTTLVVNTGSIVPGGGSSFATLSLIVSQASEEKADRSRLAMEAFSRALEIIPATLIENAGGDVLDSILLLRASSNGEESWGINEKGKVEILESSIIHPTKTILNGIIGATEAACSLLRIDQVISARGD
jgi:chaperonin GroEL (HSP60 family)